MCDSTEISKLLVWPTLYLSFENPGENSLDIADADCDKEFSAIGREDVFQTRTDSASMPCAIDAQLGLRPLL